MAVMVLHDASCGHPEITSSRVIAEALPGVQDVVFRSAGQGGKIGEKAQPLMIVRDDRSHLCLLEHELGHQDSVRVFRAPPGKLIAAPFSVPGKETAAEKCGVDDRVRANTGSVQRPTLNVQC